MKVDGQHYYFTYDPSGTPLAMTWNGKNYYYVTNLQGDVTDILDNTGAVVTSYLYDAWGKLLSVSGSLAGTVGRYNPLRYRGYVYDTETGLYYLQSRYYNPETGRFVNADGYVATGQGLLGNNMFAYCGNNPVNSSDPTGQSWTEFWGFVQEVFTETKQIMGNASDAYAYCSNLGQMDGPLPIGDVVGVLGVGLITVGAVGLGVYNVTTAQSSSILKHEEAEKSPEETVIYRYGGINPGNLTPSSRDVQMYKTTGMGLSFSTIPRPGAARTTIGALNATGVVYAVRDAGCHVSVHPIGGTLADWHNMGSTSIWTMAVKSVVQKWDGEN
jgi:RHS repeat-associated protein